jgi:hypothetical protein
MLFSFVIVLVLGRSQVIALEGSYSDICKHGADDFINGEADWSHQVSIIKEAWKAKEVLDILYSDACQPSH